MDNQQRFECIKEGYYYLEKSDLENALCCFSKAIDSYKNEGEDVVLVVQALMGRSLIYRFQKKNDLAISDLERCLVLIKNPEEYISHNIRFDIGLLYFQKKDHVKALDFLVASLDHSFTDAKQKVEIFKMIVGCCIYLEMEEAAVEYSEKGLIYRDDPYFHAAKVIRIKNLRKAREYAEGALLKFPRYVMLRYHYAVILHQSGEYELSLQQLDLCLRQKPAFVHAEVFKNTVIREREKSDQGRSVASA
jgi:tetratricopeptide (TPR) repeat protein